MGDAILRYARSGLAALKEENPDAWVRLAVMCVGPSSPALFEHCPLIDELIAETWDGSGAEFDAKWVNGLKPVPRGGQPAPIFLGQDELPLEGFAAVHPFAGTGDRDWRGKVDTEALIRELIGAGLKVVLLGGDSERTDGWGTPGTVQLRESMDLEMPGLINLVGRASVREQAYATMNAEVFVGTFSAYHSAAIAYDVPRAIITSRNYQRNIETPDPERGVVADHTHVAYFDDFDMSALLDSLLSHAV